MNTENKNKQKSIYDSEEHVQWGGLLNEFLWICAGADRKILRQCPTDYAKYAGIGGTILFTALMAMLSGGYAMFSVFDNPATAIAFGIFWGLLIFNLDRFIVNTMYSDGKVTISWGELGSGLPRIIMAIFLGIVISTPLELKIFEDEISVKIEEMKADRLAEYSKDDQIKLDSLKRTRQELVASPVDPIYGGQMASSSSKAMDLSSQLNNLATKITNLQTELSNVQGQINSIQKKLNGLEPDSPEYSQLQSQIEKLIPRRNNLRSQVTQLNSEKTKVSSDLRNTSNLYEEAMKKAEAQRERDVQMLADDISNLEEKVRNASLTYNGVISKNYDGFQAKMKAFSAMKDEDSSTKTAALFIMLLFVIIETAPTFFKMMIASGPYDDLLRAEMHRVRVLSEKRISDINDEINTEVQISVEKNKERLEAELAANKTVMDRISAAQAEILDVAIEEWRKQELEKVNQNPAAYIKVNETQLKS